MAQYIANDYQPRETCSTSKSTLATLGIKTSQKPLTLVKYLRKTITVKLNWSTPFHHVNRKIFLVSHKFADGSTRCMEIHGIPVSDNEDLFIKVNDAAEKLGLSALTTNDVIAAHRLSARQDKVPGIIIRFARQSVRETWFERRRTLAHKSVSDGASQGDVLILENLTKQNRALLYDTK